MLNAERAVMENPRRELAFVGPAPGFSVLLKRNCSISPAALARVLAFLAGSTSQAPRARAELAAELAKRMRH
jgi:hypothetical protein